MFDGVTDIKAYSTQNRPECFNTDSTGTGASAMVAPNGDVLVIAANYLDKARKISLDVDFKELGIDRRWKAFKLNADYAQCRYEAMGNPAGLSFDLDGYGVMGMLFVAEENAWRGKLDKFVRPYPSSPAEEKEYELMLENLKRLRFEPKLEKEVYIKPEIFNFPNNYEDSLILDLYDNVMELREMFADGTHERLGYLTPAGLSDKLPSKAERLYPWSDTAWIPLHKVIKHKGFTKLAVATRRGDFEFYSFIHVKISDKPEMTGRTYDISYNNDIDLDWSVLNFNVNLT